MTAMALRERIAVYRKSMKRLEELKESAARKIVMLVCEVKVMACPTIV